MNKALFLIPVVVAIMGIGIGVSFSGNSEITVQEIPDYTSEQNEINAQLEARGLTQIDGKWYDEEYLIQQEALEAQAKYAAENGLEFNPPLQLGGFVLVEHYDANRNVISTQEVHNRVVNQGEDFLIDSVFKEGTVPESSDSDQIASICVSDEVGFVDTSETETAALFDTGNLLTGNNCIADAAVTSTAQTAVIGALTFDAPTHVPATTTITGIGICQGSASTPFNDCADAQAASAGIMWSYINIADVTLQTSETVDITYTADFASAGS